VPTVVLPVDWITDDPVTVTAPTVSVWLTPGRPMKLTVLLLIARLAVSLSRSMGLACFASVESQYFPIWSAGSQLI
jgi:hypothetical protein